MIIYKSFKVFIQDNKISGLYDLAGSFSELTVKTLALTLKVTKKQSETKIMSANFKKKLHPSYIKVRIQRMEASSVYRDETVHYEPSYFTVITLNIGTPRPATVVVLNIKQFNFTLK